MVSWSAFELACKANPCARRIPPVRTVSSAEALDLIQYPTAFLAGRSEEVAPTPIVVPTVPVQGAHGLSKRTVVPVVPATAVPATAVPVTVIPVFAASAAAPVDPLRIAMEIRDPMYGMAAFHQRKAMECEEAQRLEGLLTSLYKTEGGRSRGWTLSGLEPMIKPRCASGADLKELHRAKVSFDWTLEDKVSVAFLDFLCVAQQIRIALWHPASKTITIYPAADASTALPKTIPLFHVEEGGKPMNCELEGAALLRHAQTHGWTLCPPTSVLKSLGHLTMAELESVGTRLGMTEVIGTKIERVAALGTFKVKQRLYPTISIGQSS
jgi:hypothetical protein